jgi:hypothetical protein
LDFILFVDLLSFNVVIEIMSGATAVAPFNLGWRHERYSFLLIGSPSSVLHPLASNKQRRKVMRCVSINIHNLQSHRIHSISTEDWSKIANQHFTTGQQQQHILVKKINHNDKDEE